VLALLRRIALVLMEGLQVHNPYLAGAYDSYFRKI
jgi:hypothetical protein